MKTIGVMVLMALAAMFMCSGCASVWSYRSSEDEILTERIYASGNQKAIGLLNRNVNADTAIRAVAMDNGGAGIGIDISNWRALSKHPVRQIGAAVLDAGMAYGTYLGAKSIGGNSGSGDTSQTAGRDITTVNVNGNGNKVGVGNSKTTTTTP